MIQASHDSRLLRRELFTASQFLVALIRALDETDPWRFMTIEGHGIDQVDILWEYSSHSLAVQVKSTERVFQKSTVRTWAADLEQSHVADNYELVLVGPITDGVARTRRVGKVRIPTPQPMDLNGLVERACYRLRHALRDVVNIDAHVETVMFSVLQRLQHLAVRGVRISRSHFESLLRAWVLHVDDEQDSEYFSTPIRSYFARLRRTVEKLTVEQYHVIAALKGAARVKIVGCAGSGKTLICSERALRLDSAGIKTLILCHSPNLALHLRLLVAGSEVDVSDYLSWIDHLASGHVHCKERKPQTLLWTAYAEPPSSKMDAALDALAQNPLARYDAILVDEGQDIRPDWWALIELSLRDSAGSLLNIFCDGNQRIVGGNLAEDYPQLDAIFEISKNCRNAASVHSIVRRFYDYAPASDDRLRGGCFGYSVLPKVERETVRSECRKAILTALEMVPIPDLVVLTGESEPAAASILHGLELWDSERPSWQLVVSHYMDCIEYTIRQRNYRFELAFDPPGAGRYYPVLGRPRSLEWLSTCETPTTMDRKYIEETVQRAAREIDLRNCTPEKLQWIPGADGLKLRSFGDSYVGKPFCFDVIAFFLSTHWTATLPRAMNLPLLATEEWCPNPDSESIRLFSAPSFKGLEADGVVVYLGEVNAQVAERACLALSRGRFWLHVIASKTQLARLPKLK